MINSKKAAVGFIFVTLLVESIGFGLIIPVAPKLIQSLIHGDISTASEWNGWLMLAYAIMQFIFAPVVGALSDRYGRRPVLLFSLLGFGLDYLLLFFAPNIWWLFAGRIIAGMTGASFTTGMAYIADVSTNENRAQNFGLVGAAFGLGFIIGPVIGGVLGSVSLHTPFLFAAGLSLLNVIYGYFVLPESLSKENRRPIELLRANPVGTLIKLTTYKGIGGLLVALIFVYLAGQAVQTTWTFVNFVKFNWSYALQGYSLGVVGILSVIIQGFLIRYSAPKLGNEKSIYIGLGLYALGLVLFAFATQSWMMFAFLVPYCLGGIAGPALQSVISEHVPANQQGELQGALTSLMSATLVVGPFFMSYLFSYFTQKNAPIYFPGAPFLAAAVLMIFSTVIAYTSMKKDAFINRGPTK